MIDVISNWAGELIVSLMLVTIIEMLLPDNKIKKYVKTVIGVYIVFCIISPFINKSEIESILANTEKSLKKIEIQSKVNSSQSEDSSIESLYIQEFQKDVIKKVEALGYKVKKCDVNLEIDATKENAGINAIYLNIGEKKKSNGNSSIEIEEVEKVEISINENNIGNNNNEETENKDTKEIKEFLSENYEISKDRIKIIQN